uniref:Carbohydrate kinase PfkB domain-containing protein n=1 Tax=Araucaria cunninghamii TaxID=56994 RepID=A0A0D6R9F3_ARACU
MAVAVNIVCHGYEYCTRAESRKPLGLRPGIGLLTRDRTTVACASSGRNDIAVKKNCKESNTATLFDRKLDTEKFRDIVEKERCAQKEKNIDVVTLGNLCVDIVLNVPELPPSSHEEKYRYMLQLAASNPDKRYWEAGGNCNFAIAAARLGLNCVTLGQVGNEKYGMFLREVLEKEGVTIIGIDENGGRLRSNDDETVLCWVLVDPSRQHSFCSRFDFNKEPAFRWINRLSAKAEDVIKHSKVLFCNGFLFDELCPGFIDSILECARDMGTAIFFDPGPRNISLLHGTPEQQQTLRRMLYMSDVLLLTAEEAESLTGHPNPILAANDLLHRGLATKWVIIKLGSRGYLMVTLKGFHYAPTFKVDVVDTVGCGDSYAAAIVIGYINSMSIITILALANAVGGATAMGCGAGRNVATIEKVSDLLFAPQLQSEYEDYWKTLLPEECLINSEIMMKKTVTNNQDNSFCAIDVQTVAQDALDLLQKFSQKDHLQVEVNP